MKFNNKLVKTATIAALATTALFLASCGKTEIPQVTTPVETLTMSSYIRC